MICLNIDLLFVCIIIVDVLILEILKIFNIYDKKDLFLMKNKTSLWLQEYENAFCSF